MTFEIERCDFDGTASYKLFLCFELCSPSRVLKEEG